MKTLLILIYLLTFSNFTFGQERIVSGEYEDGLKLAYDSDSKKITGYFESYTGWDEENKTPRFSCIFYIEGILEKGKAKITTYYPEDKTDDIIEGSLEFLNNSVTIKLPEEHGGCWNVQHFADKPAQFQLEKKHNWIQIRYIDSNKSNFFSDKSIAKKLKTYLIKGDIIYVEKLEGEWAFCTYLNKKNKNVKGWLKTSDLNKL